MTTYFYNYVPLFKALADETRLKIVHMLTLESMCANSILECFSITQPSLSYHMKILTSCGLVRARRQGGFTMYSVEKAHLNAAIALLQEFIAGMELMQPEVSETVQMQEQA